MRTNRSSRFAVRHLAFVLAGAFALCLAVLPARAQSNYWGNGLSFNGASSYVVFGATPPVTGSWTAEFWVNRQDSTNTAATLLDDGITSLRLEQFNGTRRVGFTRYGVADYMFNYTAPTNTWVHLAFVSDSLTTRLYVNGVAQDTNLHSIALPLRQFGAITNNLSGVNSAMKGTVDEIRVWNVARSAADIQANLAQSLTNTPAGLVGYWKFDEGSGLITQDATTNHHDGTLVNGPAWVVSTVPFPFSYETNYGTITITGYTGPGSGVVIPSSINDMPVTSIEGSAFFNCYSLTSISIPDTVTSIGDYAFFSCYGLTNVIIPDSVISIVSDAFANCTGLMSITVGTNNPVYSSLDGVLFNKTRTMLVEAPGGKTGYYAIPDSVTCIGQYAFFYCTRLTGVRIPNSVTNIGDMAFTCCESLTSIKIPEGVPRIGYAEFQNCYYLTNITIPNSVTNIGAYAFIGCWGLQGVYFQGNAPSLDDPAPFMWITPAVYCRPGSTGWAAFNALSGVSPAVVWNARVQTGGGFGMRTNHFGFTISGTTNIPVVVEACTNLASPAWVPIQCCLVTNGTINFCDPQSCTNYPARFYNVRWP